MSHIFFSGTHPQLHIRHVQCNVPTQLQSRSRNACIAVRLIIHDGLYAAYQCNHLAACIQLRSCTICYHVVDCNVLVCCAMT